MLPGAGMAPGAGVWSPRCPGNIPHPNDPQHRAGRQEKSCDLAGEGMASSSLGQLIPTPPALVLWLPPPTAASLAGSPALPGHRAPFPSSSPLINQQKQQLCRLQQPLGLGRLTGQMFKAFRCFRAERAAPTGTPRNVLRKLCDLPSLLGHTEDPTQGPASTLRH